MSRTYKDNVTLRMARKLKDGKSKRPYVRSTKTGNHYREEVKTWRVS